MLYRSTDCLGGCGAPVQNPAVSASLYFLVNSEPSKSGIKQLVGPFVPNRAVVALDAGILRGGPVWICFMAIPLFSAHISSLRQMYSGALSPRLVLGVLRHSTILSKLRITRSTGSEKSTLLPSPSRLKSYRTFSSRNARPAPSRLAMKSIDHAMLGASGTARASGLSRFNHLRGVRLCHSDPWRSMARPEGSVPAHSRCAKPVMVPGMPFDAKKMQEI